jgi:phosphoglycerol transferase MdoB-like AlkP superfamily enzyme
VGGKRNAVSAFVLLQKKLLSRLIKNIVYQAIFWLIFFNVPRIIFLVYHATLIRIEKISFAEILLLFPHAFRLDLATLCYLIAIPFIISIVQSIRQSKILYYIQLFYSGFILFFYSLLAIGETGVYAEWKTKLDYKSLYYLKNPGEIAQSSSTGEFIVLITLFIILFISSLLVFKRLIMPSFSRLKEHWIPVAIYALLMPVLLGIGIRGGLQQVPVNQSESYYSRHNILNLVAVNPAFNMLHSYINNQEFEDKNPFLFYTQEEAKRTVDSLFQTDQDTTVSLFNLKQPNIVFIILESWSADLIESLGGEPGITPRFHELEKDGVLFTGFYASGNRSQQGMASIFGGFPAIPVTAITHHSNKFIKLPSLTKKMNAAGYHSSFYFGGQLIYGGLRAYMMFNEFDRIIELKDFDKDVPQGKLGVHDQYLYDRHIREMRTEKQPFFTAMFTMSSHSPYDQPMKPVLSFGGNEKQFVNSAYYADSCLGDYLKRVKTEAWYKNTVFIIVADHSHNTYRNWSVNSPQYRKIPFLIYGEPLKAEFMGRKIDRISSQTDIPKTVLEQLNLESQDFHWSRDLMNPHSREFAFWEINVGGGWIKREGYYIYQNTTGMFDEMTFSGSERDKAIKEGKSFLQVLFQEFIDF